MRNEKSALLVDDKIHISFPFDEALVQAVRGIAGRKWSPEGRIWIVPNTPWHADRVAEVLMPLGFYIDPAIAKGADHKAPPPKHKYPAGLYPFQRRGIDFLYDTGGRAILADEMGIGKSAQALVFAITFAGRCLIVCPANVVYKWAEVECPKWAPDKSVQVVTTGKDEIGDADITIMSYAMMVSHYETLNQKPYDIVIYDECHALKGRKTQRGRVGRALIKNGIPKVIFVSGTPFLNRPDELFPFLNILDPVGFANFYEYAKRYCNPPEAPIWMGDYSFKPIGDVTVGDYVIGWKPYEQQVKPGGKGLIHQDKLTRAKVLAVHRHEAEIVKVTFESGRIIRCTPDHLWRTDQTASSKYAYGHVKVGRNICHVIDPSPIGDGQLWLSGIYDGEGCGNTIAQDHRHNPEVCRRIGSELSGLGVSYSYSEAEDRFYILGGRQGMVDFLNAINPTKRVTSSNDRYILTRRPRNLDRVVSVEPDGYGEVISLTTETGNYVAWGYASHNCGAEYINGTWFFPPGLVTNRDELAQRLRRLMIRRTKKDPQVELDLPDLTRTIVPVELENKAAYKKALKDVREWLADQDRSVLNPAHALTRLAVLRQIVGEGKIKAAVELAEDILQDGKKVVLFCHHKAVVASLADKLKGYGVRIISGDTGQEERQQIVKAFLDGNLRVIVMTTAGAEGIDLYAASDIIFVERQWTPAKEEQAEGRLHRIGQKNPVNSWYLVAKSTIDEKLDNMVSQKRKVIGQVISQDEVVTKILEDL